MAGSAMAHKKMKYDFIYTGNSLTITNIPYHGFTDIEFELDPLIKYIPFMQLDNPA